MIDDLFQNEADESTIFRDVIFLALIAFVAMLITVIPFLADPTEREDEEVVSPGNLITEIIWDPKLHDDLDLWVIGPKEPGAVGYSNKSGIMWNLLRDDLGNPSDLSGMNYENAYTRGLQAGWYRFNVHWYNSQSGVTEIAVKMVISIKKNPTDSVRQLVVRDVTITRSQKEVTLFYFYLDENFNIDKSSISWEFECLHCGRSSGDDGM